MTKPTRKPAKRPIPFARALTIVRDRFIAYPNRYQGDIPNIQRATDCGCICAHLEQVCGVGWLDAITELFPLHAGWLCHVFSESEHRIKATGWAIRTINAKLRQLKGKARS